MREMIYKSKANGEKGMERGMKEVLLPRNGGWEERKRRAWREWKRMWRVAAPAVFSRVVTYSANVITQAFAGHLGDLQLASMSIANNVVLGFSFGLLLGMASAMETLCGQAYGAKQHRMLGIYMQRSWLVLFACATAVLPLYFCTSAILELCGQPHELAAMAGRVSVWLIPLHYSFVILLPMQRFLQCQQKNSVHAVASAAALVLHVLITWLFVCRFKLGLFGTAMTLNLTCWVAVAGLLGYIFCGGCENTWLGFSAEAFAGLWEFLRLSVASGIMLCLENWYYRILILLAAKIKNAEIAVDALSVCMSINGWEMMIPLAFFTAAGVRVANEVGAGNSSSAKFAATIAIITSGVIGVIFFVLILTLHDEVARIFTASGAVIGAVDRLSTLLAITILLNSVQPVLSGIAVGLGWQSIVAYINIGSYYLIGIPVGVLLGCFFHYDVQGLWAGMVGGTAVQTLILTVVTIRCDWDKQTLIACSRVNKFSLPDEQ